MSERKRWAVTYLGAIANGYQVINKESKVLYCPNLVSIRKRIISA